MYKIFGSIYKAFLYSHIVFAIYANPQQLDAQPTKVTIKGSNYVVPHQMGRKLDVLNEYMSYSLLEKNKLAFVDSLFSIERDPKDASKIVQVSGYPVHEVCISKGQKFSNQQPPQEQPSQYNVINAMRALQKEQAAQEKVRMQATQSAQTQEIRQQAQEKKSADLSTQESEKPICFLALQNSQEPLYIFDKISAQSIVKAADLLKLIIKASAQPINIGYASLPFVSSWLFPAKIIAPMLMSYSYYFLNQGYRSGFNLDALLAAGIYKKYIAHLLPWPLASVWWRAALFTIYQLSTSKFRQEVGMFRWLAKV